ncbi:hypothetical protein Celf_2554 [Cellulomonas fimi ATCC 484]|uniref:Uncharacterized protein n=2 Tax=Cellulomonas fimi TaxID=1708 RepID=F4H573_CELFA|nr:hypothetical protein Celf_2554 [Cellulomonas fimi ATCC 484]VEH33861.1 Uncharacterised protein [Cellulomonas fimi]
MGERRVTTRDRGATMSTTDEQGTGGRDDEAEELAQGGGVGLGAGEPTTFEPEEDPEAPAAGPSS